MLLSTVNLGASLLYKVPTGSGQPQVTYDDVAQQMYAVRPASPPSHIIFDAVLCKLCGIQQPVRPHSVARDGLQCTIAIGIDGPLRQSHGASAFSQWHIICHRCRNHRGCRTCVTSTSPLPYLGLQKHCAFQVLFFTCRCKLHKPPVRMFNTQVIDTISNCQAMVALLRSGSRLSSNSCQSI